MKQDDCNIYQAQMHNFQSVIETKTVGQEEISRGAEK